MQRHLPRKSSLAEWLLEETRVQHVGLLLNQIDARIVESSIGGTGGQDDQSQRQLPWIRSLQMS